MLHVIANDGVFVTDLYIWFASVASTTADQLTSKLKLAGFVDISGTSNSGVFEVLLSLCENVQWCGTLLKTSKPKHALRKVCHPNKTSSLTLTFKSICMSLNELFWALGLVCSRWLVWTRQNVQSRRMKLDPAVDCCHLQPLLPLRKVSSFTHLYHAQILVLDTQQPRHFSFFYKTLFYGQKASVPGVDGVVCLLSISKRKLLRLAGSSRIAT